MKTCKYCKEEIHKDATTCKHCGRHQKGFLNLMTYLSDSAVILTFILFIISILQYIDSRYERMKAKEAYETAINVKTEVLKLYNQVDSIRHNIDSIATFINRTSLLNIQNSWIQANTPIMGFNTNRPSVKRFEKNTNELIRLLMPDSIVREKWVKETDNLLKQ